MLAQALGGQEGTYVESQLLIMERNGYPEETYYTFSYSPIPPTMVQLAAFFLCKIPDDTQRVIGERQLSLLRELAATTAEARTRQTACERSAQALAKNSRDLPFTMIYMLEPDGRNAILYGVSGIDPYHPAAMATLSLDEPGPWPLPDVLASHRALLVPALRRHSRRLSRAWRFGIGKSVPRSRPANDDQRRNRPFRFLIAGLNPFRVFDENYSGFLKFRGRSNRRRRCKRRSIRARAPAR